ncbi:XRE family transcriptional regulator [Nocardia sp. NPDC051570]|uniref:XRE family transcriptional regulator n=1 Tax=Nocardia sp. NPDC051570 TaxID=3364324 RepID=UPI0037AAA009
MPPNLQFQRRREATASRIIPGRIMGRAELAEAVNDFLWRVKGQRCELDARAIARYERGVVRWPNDAYREAFCVVLNATDAELGFTPVRSRRKPADQPEKTTDLDLFSPFEPSATEVELTELEGSADTPTGRVGWAEVEQVREATKVAAGAENLHGGGNANLLATKYVRRYQGLVRGQASPAVRRALFEAIGNLSGVAGYAAYDAGDHAVAERRFRFAYWCANAAGSWELRASTLADMARKIAYVGNPDAALSLIELAQVRSDRLSATALAMLAALRAQYLAAMGRIDEALKEVARADEHFAERNPITDAPWLCFYDRAEHLGSTGKALMPAAQSRQQIELAAPRIREAVALQGMEYPRSQTFSLTRLATLTMQLGDPREAAALGLRATAQADRLNSQRIQTELGNLAAAASRHRRMSDVIELRDAITHQTMSGAKS